MPHSLRYYLAALLGLMAVLLAWYYSGRPVDLADAATSEHKLQCASYTPYARDQSPYDQPLTLRAEQIDSDLALLATRFTCIRTYAMTGLDGLPAVARKHGLKLMLGAWVNANPVDTARELKALVTTANANPDVVQSVVVGNEVLLRKELTGDALAALITQVKGQVQQPVTYADVWEFWERYPQVAKAVDFVTVHLLPYWEDQPKGIGDALEHVRQVHDRLAERYAPKAVMIGEAGWPSEGRQRETAQPSRINEARFIRGFVSMAEQHGWRYNLIEAFDQPWKRRNEGAVGGYWGLYDAHRQDKGVLAGPASDLPHWPRWALASVVLYLGLLAVGGRHWRVPLLAATGSVALGRYALLGISENRGVLEWTWGLALLALGAGILLWGVLAEGRRGAVLRRLDRYAGTGLCLAAFAAASLQLMMVFDPRYRAFQTMALVIPALVFVLRPVPAPRREIALLGAIIGLGVLPQLWREGLLNPQAWGWALVSVGMAVACWRSRARRAPAAMPR